ncbi:hypothetical protein [Bosea sp. RAC05]|uniref:hypothetical protein n=1 Tax=Bosea sp. RAC05 TaxID=1842539 RepID=UPI00083D5C08|nr:hypothetical protein [Bosea sp. RAC05]AOG03342.1 hypothetical protein BSY19_5214 [Bosea sp. RAC05]
MPKIHVEFNDTTVDIEVKAGASLREAVTAVIDAPEITAVLQSAVKDEYFEAYSNDGSVNDDWNMRAAKAFIDHGLEGLEEWITEESDDNVDGRLHQAISAINDKPEISELIDAAIDGLKDARRNKASDIRAMFDELIDDTLADMLRASDKSKPLDLISARDDVLLSYVPGVSGLSTEDIHTNAIDSVHSAETVLLDERLIPFFKLINLAKDDFIAYCREQHGIDLTGRLVADGVSSYRVEDDARRAELWKTASWTVDSDRPALITPAEAFEVLENATYGGVPCLTVKVPLRWFIERDWSLGMTIEPHSLAKGSMVAGQIGIHNFVNGSGHTITNENTVIIPAGDRQEFVVSEKTGYGFDSAYGFVGWALKAGRFQDVPAAPEQKIEDESVPDMRV